MQKSKIKNKNYILKLKNFELCFVILIFAFCILHFLTGCQMKLEKEKAPEAIPVKVLRVELKDLYETLEYAGNIKAQDEVMVYPKVSGKISEKIKEDGEMINKGEAIAYIDRDEVGLKFEKAPVDSPINGTLGRLYIDIGQNVHPQEPIALIVNMDTVQIILDIPEKYLPKVSLNQRARISADAYPTEKWTGVLTKISPVLDLATRTAPIEITIDNPLHCLRSGMFARAELIIGERKNVPVILKEAIIGKGQDAYVFAVENKKAMSKKIKTGAHQGPYYEVLEGVKENDLVVIMGQQKLRDGALVEAEE